MRKTQRYTKTIFIVKTNEGTSDTKIAEFIYEVRLGWCWYYIARQGIQIVNNPLKKKKKNLNALI